MPGGTKILTRIATWLGIDSSGVDKGMIKAEKAVTKGRRKIGKQTDLLERDFLGVRNAVMGLAGAIGGALTVRAFARFATESASVTDKVGKLADRLGVSVEFLSRMRFAAELSGVSADAFGVAIQRAIRRLEQFRDTGKGEAAEALRILGSGLDDAVRSGERFEDIFPRLAEAFRRLPTEAQRVLAAMKLFDTEGVGLVSMFLDGAAGIKSMSDEADRLGATLGEVEAKQAARFNDALLRLSTQADAAKRSMVGLGAVMLDEFGKTAEKVSVETEQMSVIFAQMAQMFGRFFRGEPQMQARTPRAPGAEVGPQIPDDLRGRLQGADGPFAAGRMSIAEPVKAGTQALIEYRDAFTSTFGPDGAVGITMLEFEQRLTDFAQNRLPTEFEAVMAQFKVVATDFYNVLGEATLAFSTAIGNSVAQALVEQENFVDALQSMLKNVLKSILAALVKLMVQFILFNTILATTMSFFGVTIPGLGGFGGGGGGGAGIAPGLFGGGLAAGGIVTKPLLTPIGEAGPEAVIPLSGAGAGLVVEMDGRIVGQIVADRIGSAAQGRGFRS